MRTSKLIVNVLVVCFVLPVAIVAILGMAFQPLQANAHTGAHRVVFQANDIMLEQPAQPAKITADPSTLEDPMWA